MVADPFAGLRAWTPERRARRVQEWARLSPAEARRLAASLDGSSGLGGATATKMIENVVGVFGLPMGLAPHFLINGREYLVPMALEEPSVVAGAAHAAKLARASGGFTAACPASRMIGQVHLVGVPDPAAAARQILARKKDVLRAARVPGSRLDRARGGAVDLEARVLRRGRASYLAVHLLVDVGDAMGANAVNERCERAAPLLEKITGGRARLRILSNLADHRLAFARAVFPAKALGGASVVAAILDAYAIAQADPYRCATHNKGIMNGIDAVAVATGNDWRAIEAGAHAYAARTGRYAPLTKFHRGDRGDLVGEIELPMAVGTVGGATRAHPVAALALKILRVKSARELGAVMASVGLAQNVAALRALVTEGIQAGHMRLHRRLKR